MDVVIYDCTLVDADTEGENSLEQLFLVSTAADGSQTLVDTQLLNCGGLGAAGLEGLFWTSDGSYFYYTDAREGVPDGCGFWERPMHRFNINDRQTEYIGGGPISPDGSKIATWVNHDLTLWNLNGDRIASIAHPIPNAIHGPIAWSPSSLSVAYLLSEDYCPLGTTYLVRMDLDALKPVVVLSSLAPSLAGISWDAPNRVILSDEQAAQWSYNFVFGQLSPYSE